MRDVIAAEMAKAAPPVTVAAITMNDVLVGASLVYVALQIIYLVWRWVREYRAAKK